MRSRVSTRAIFRAAAATTIVMAGRAAAQSEKFTDGKVAVVEAKSFIDDARNGQYVWGESLSMSVKTTPEAVRISKLKLKARIFPMNADEVIPSPWIRFEPCDVYYTMVIPNVRISARRTITLASINNIGWLILADGRPARGRFRVVFEAQSDDEPVFRLDRNKRKEYFARSLYIEVRSNGDGGGGQARSAQQLLADRDRVLSVVRQNDPKWICYRYETAGVETPAQEHLAGLGRCTDRPAELNGKSGINL